MAEAELQELADDIKANGLIEPIVLCNGEILDGRNRYLACIEAKVEPGFKDYQGSDPLTYVVSKNLKRRHLTRQQRDEIITYMRQQGMSYRAIAEATGVSAPTVMRAVDAPGVTFVTPHIIGKDGKIYPATKPHIAQATGESEWYTPKEYIDAGVAVMGGIDLDPASTEAANAVVGAATFYDAEVDGLAQDWAGRIWMNPPYSMPLIASFAHKLAKEVRAGKVTEAIVLVNNATETGWFNEMIAVAAAVCFPRSRIRFWAPGRESATPLQGQALIYIGQNVGRFRDAYADIGWSAAL